MSRNIDYDYYCDFLLNYKRFPGKAFYSLAVFRLFEGKSDEAMQLLNKAYKANYSFGFMRYAFDPHLKDLYNNKEFIDFVTPK